MRLTIPALIVALFALPIQAADTTHTALHDYRVVTVAEGLVRPWSMAFLPDGTLLVTEKPGRLRVIREGKLQRFSVEGVPAVFAQGQGGLLDVVPHPAFEDNRWLYLSFAKPLGEGQSTTAVIRGRFDGAHLTDIETLLEASTRGRGHYGSRLAFDGAGHLFITIGDRQASPSGDLAAHPAQDRSNHHGTVLRLNEDGSIPDDNPFVGTEGVRPEIWSWGHRNAQGLAIDDQGGVWITEHGPQGGDELNRIEAGVNYGWPVIGYGVNYRTGSAIHGATHQDGMAQPVKVWVPSIGTSGLAIVRGDAFPHWRGRFLAGGLSGERLDLIEVDGGRLVSEETIVRGLGRIRDVRVGPDGFIYLAIDGRDGSPTPIVRLEPVTRAPIPLN